MDFGPESQKRLRQFERDHRGAGMNRQVLRAFGRRTALWSMSSNGVADPGPACLE